MARRRADSNENGTKPLKERLSSAGLEERMEENRHRRVVEHEAERLAVEEAELEEQSAQQEQEGQSRQQRRAEERRRTKLLARKLRLLERNDEAVIDVLKRERRIDHILEGGQPTEADEMLWFLAEELKLTKALEALSPPETYFDEEKGKEIKRRRMYPALVMNLLAVMGWFMGLSSGPELQAKLLTDPRWMALLGFTHDEVMYGATRRSESLIGKTRDGQGGAFEDAGPMGPARARLEGPRGALSSQTLALCANIE